MDPREMEYQLDDEALEEIGTLLNSLTWNGSRPPRLNNDGSPSQAEMEKCQKDILEQRIQMTAFMEKSGTMEKKIGILQRDLKTSDSKIENLQSLLASEREDKAEVEAKINTLNDAFQKTVNLVGPLNTRLVATEESFKVLKEKVEGFTRDTIEGLSSISKEIEIRFAEMNENHARRINDIQRVKVLVNESYKEIQSNLEVSELNFSKVYYESHKRVTDELRSIEVAMKDLEKQMQSEIQLAVTETDKNQSGVTDEMKQLNLTKLELQQRIMSAGPLTPATAKGGDGSDNNLLVITANDDEEKKEEDVIPQEQEIPFMAAKYIVEEETSSKTMRSSDPPSATTSSTTTQNQNVTDALDKTKTGPLLLSTDGQVTKVQETPKAIARSPPKPSTIRSTSVEKKTPRHHGRDPAREMFCLCGVKFCSPSALYEHLKYYTAAEKEWVCNCKQFCKGIKSQEEGLNEHLRNTTHSQIKPKETINSTVEGLIVDAYGQVHKFIPLPRPTSSSKQSGSVRVREGSRGVYFYCQCGKSFVSETGVANHIRIIAQGL